MKCDHVTSRTNEWTVQWVVVLYVISVCTPGNAIYVTAVPGIVSVHRGNSAVLRWAVDVPVAQSRPVRILNGQNVELISNYFGVTSRLEGDSETGDIDESRIDLILSDDRTVIEVRFYSTQESDNGLYTLSIAAVEDEGVRSAGRLLVYFAPEWREFGGGDSRTVYARLGDKNVTVNCSVAANPRPLFTWEYIEGPKAPSSSSSSSPGTTRPPTLLVERSEQSWITVEEVTAKDFGVYTCTTTNTASGAYGERHHFVSVFNVTLEERVDSKMAATVAAILLPILIFIVVVALIMYCVSKRCGEQGCSSMSFSCCCCCLMLDQGGTQKDKGDAQYEDASVPLNQQMHMHVMHHANNGHHGDYQQVSAYYYSTPYDYGMDRQQYAMPVPVPLPVLPGPPGPPIQAPVQPVLPVTLSSIAEEDDGACDSSDDNATPRHQPSPAVPPPVYAVARMLPSLTVPVRTAPSVPLTTKVPAPIPVPVPVVAPSVSPARMAPPKPARSALQDSQQVPASTILTSPTSQADQLVPASYQGHSSGAARSLDPPAHFQDADARTMNSAAATNGSPAASQKVTRSGSGSPVITESGSRSMPDGSEVRPELEGDTDHDSGLDNNNKTLSAFVDVIYADVTVHAPMGGQG